MMDLVDFYNNQLRKVKFTRNSISLIKSSSNQNLQTNLNTFERIDPLQKRLQEEYEREQINQKMPYLKKSDSSYLKTRFQQLENKGLDRVARKNVLGTKAEIE